MPTSNCSLGGWCVHQGCTTTTTTSAHPKPPRRRRTTPPVAPPPPPPPRPDDDAERHSTHPHAYEQLLVGWMTGAVCYSELEDHCRTTRHPPHAYELLGWIVGATDDNRGMMGKWEIGPRRRQRRL